jgi:hypothetical protein
MMQCPPPQFWDGHGMDWISVVVIVTRLAPRLFRHARAAARQSARQPAGAGLGIASTTATTAATLQRVIGL